MTETPRWFTSSYSGNGGQCVQAAANLVAPQGIVPVRDSKTPHAPGLVFQAATWSAFVTDIKATGQRRLV